MTTDTKDDLGSELPGEVWHTAMRYTGLAAARRIVWLTKVLRRCKQRMRDAERVAANRATHVASCHDMTARAQNVAIAASAEKSELSDQLNAARKEADELRTELDAARKEAERQHAETMRAERWGETQFDARRKAEQALEAEAATARTMRFRREVADKEVDQLRAQRDRAERLCQEQATLVKQLEERLRQATQSVDRSKLPTVPPRVGYRYERRDGTECRIDYDLGAERTHRYQSDDGRTYTPRGAWGCFGKADGFDLVREIGPIKQGDKS